MNARLWPAVLCALTLLACATRVASAETDEVMDIRQLVQAGWKAPHPPYPATAGTSHANGMVFLRLKTDSEGKIAEAKIADQPESLQSEPIRKTAVSYVRANWHGPPNSSASVKILFRID